MRAAIDISEYPLEELRADRKASIEDIRVCHFALACGVTHHKDGLPVQERLEVNQNIVKTIDAELSRRKEQL